MNDQQGKGRPGLRRRLLIAAVLLGAVAVLAAVWLAAHPRRLSLPGDDLAGAEARVAHAVAVAQEAVRADPQSADAWGRLGMVLMTHEYIGPARECFQQAEQRDPRDPRWLYLRAFTYQTDDPNLAAQLLERAVGLAEDDPTCRLSLAETLVRLGRTDEARRHFLLVADGAASGGQPEAKTRAHLGLARLDLEADDLPGALKHADQAARLAPRLRSPVELHAAITLRMGDAAASRRDQDRLANLVDSPWSDPYLEMVMRHNVGLAPRLELGQRLLQQGRSQDAVAVLEEVIRDEPESAPAWISLSRAWLRLGGWGKAQAAAERALALSPDDALAWADLGTALAEQGEHQKGADCFRRSLRLNPNDGDTHYQLAFACIHLKDRPAAEAEFRESVRVRPQFASGWRELGRLLAEKGADAEAVECLRRAVELAPEDEVARGLLAEVMRKTGSQYARPGSGVSDR